MVYRLGLAGILADFWILLILNFRKMQTINLIEISYDGETKPPHQYDLTFLPRIGEKISLLRSDETDPTLYEVVDVHHHTRDSGNLDVYAHYIGSLKNVVNRMVRQID